MPRHHRREDADAARDVVDETEEPLPDEVARRGGDEERPDDPGAEPLRPLPGQREDAHAAHRVPDQDDGGRRGDRVDHGGEVAAGLVDGGVGGLAPAGAPVAALVPRHDAGVPVERGDLRRPELGVDGEAVAEHHGRAVGAADGDVEGDAVVADDSGDGTFAPSDASGPAQLGVHLRPPGARR